MCRKLRLVSKKKSFRTGSWSSCQKLALQFVKQVPHAFSAPFVVFLGLETILHSPFSLVCHSDAATIRQIAIFGKVVVHSMTRKLAFAHVISLKRGQDE